MTTEERLRLALVERKQRRAFLAGEVQVALACSFYGAEASEQIARWRCVCRQVRELEHALRAYGWEPPRFHAQLGRSCDVGPTCGPCHDEAAMHQAMRKRR